MQYDSLILYDWFSVTAKHHSVTSIIDLLGMNLDSFEPAKGARGYHERLYFGGVSIHYGGREEIWLEMSGKGCRCFETHGHGAWDSLFEEVLSDDNYHMTRLDVAFDDHEGLLDLQLLFQEADAGNFVSKFKYWEICKSSSGITIYHGSPSSDVRFRIYDKAAERGREDEGHWVRFEIQLRDDKATNFLNLLLLRPIGDTFINVVNHYLRYVRRTNDKNKWRWPVADYWAAFIGTAGKLSLYVAPGEDYNLEKLERFAVNQAGAAVAAYSQIVGEDTYLKKCRERLLMTSNPRYGNLIQQCADETEENTLAVLEILRTM